MKHWWLWQNYIKDVSKILGQTAKVSSSHQSKERISNKHMSENEWFLSLIKKLHSTANTETI
jgi:hypothetical protein